MISARAIWTDAERFLGEATSRHALVIDAASEKTASSPMELVLIKLLYRIGGKCLARPSKTR